MTPVSYTHLDVYKRQGFTAQKTINIAENLYMNGFISYPRTDNTVYPSSIDLKEVLNLSLIHI